MYAQASKKGKDTLEQLQAMELNDPESLCEHIDNFADTYIGW